MQIKSSQDKNSSQICDKYYLLGTPIPLYCAYCCFYNFGNIINNQLNSLLIYKQLQKATLHFQTFTQNIRGENVIQISEDNLFEEIEDLYQVIELWGPGPGHCVIMGINNPPCISHPYKPNLRSKPVNLLHLC